jgi:hypothetical protein
VCFAITSSIGDPDFSSAIGCGLGGDGTAGSFAADHDMIICLAFKSRARHDGQAAP